jgi:hypothetical protein
MARARTTVTLDEEVLRAVKLRAAASGRGDSEVIEDALRVQLGLDFLDSMWARASLAEDAAIPLAVEAQHKTRRRRRS